MRFNCKRFIYQLICNNFININGSLWSKYFCFVLQISVIFYRKIHIFIEISFISYYIRSEIMEFSTIAIFHSNAFSFLHSYDVYMQFSCYVIDTFQEIHMLQCAIRYCQNYMIFVFVWELTTKIWWEKESQ